MILTLDITSIRSCARGKFLRTNRAFTHVFFNEQPSITAYKYAPEDGDQHQQENNLEHTSEDGDQREEKHHFEYERKDEFMNK